MREANIDRREFTKLALGGAIIISVTTGTSIGRALAAVSPTRIRSDISDPNKGKDATERYRAAVSAVKGLDTGDSRSWLKLSAIHRNYCPHGNWFFLPWHRAYLLAFEDICREVAKDKDFALPYWNWSTFRQLPPGFVDAKLPNGVDNELYHEARVMKGNDTLSSILNSAGIDAETIFGASNITNILGKPTFQEFGSLKPTAQIDIDKRWQRAPGSKTILESGPHDFLHGIVGGDMGQVAISPQDPIFYLHHCNLDRLWAHWSHLGHKAETDPLWLNFTYQANFPKTDGGAGGNLKNSALLDAPTLGYQYDDLVERPSAAAIPKIPLDLKELTLRNWAQPLSTGAVAELQLNTVGALNDRISSVVKSQSTEKRVYVFLDGVTRPREPRVKVRVFLNCDYLTPLTPLDDPHYVSSFTFFVMDDNMGAGMENMEHEGQSFAFDVTEVARKLATSSGRSSEELTVQLLPLGFDGKPIADNDFKVQSIKIATI